MSIFVLRNLNSQYMVLKIDTLSKRISVEGTESLGEIIEQLVKLFPDGAWKEFKLENTDIAPYPSYPILPIIIDREYPVYPQFPQPQFPISTPTSPWFHQPYTIICHSHGTSISCSVNSIPSNLSIGSLN